MTVTLLKHYAAGPSGPDALRRGRVAIDSAAVPTQDSVETTFTFPGARVGDCAWASPMAQLDTGISYAGARVVADEIVAIALSNITTASINPAAATWVVSVLLTP